MNNTKPEIRVNKLGIPVTKHVLIDASAKGSPKKLPPVPVVQTSPMTATPQQLTNADVVMSSRLFASDDRIFNLLGEVRAEPYTFNASPAEIFSVYSVTNCGNALALMEMGVRTADEARDALYEAGASDLIKDRSAVMEEAMKRELPYDKTAYLFQKLIDPLNAESTPYVADALEFYAWKGNVGVKERMEICNDIIDGTVRLDDLKSIGLNKLDTSSAVHAVTASLKKFSKRKKKPYTPAEMGQLLNKAKKDRVEGDDIAIAVEAIEKFGIDGIKKLDDLYHVVSHHWYLEDDKTPVESAYYAALVSEGTQRAGRTLSDVYLSTTFVNEIVAFRSAKISAEQATALFSQGHDAEESIAYLKLLDDEGIAPDEALPLIAEGKSAQEIIGIRNGINPSVADGWL